MKKKQRKKEQERENETKVDEEGKGNKMNKYMINGNRDD
jgi:hypothetical protein